MAKKKYWNIVLTDNIKHEEWEDVEVGPSKLSLEMQEKADRQVGKFIMAYRKGKNAKEKENIRISFLMYMHHHEYDVDVPFFPDEW